MSIFCQKNVHSLKNTVLSYHFFQIFNEKPSAAMLIFVSKNVNSFKNKQYHVLKKSIGCTFFRFFTKKPLFSFPYFVNKTIISKKDTHSLKSTVLSCLFSNFHEKPHPAMPIFGQKKRQVCYIYTTFWVQKVNWMPFLYFS